MMVQWSLFVSHLPSSERTLRMRLWRGLRGLGAAILRDGVYLLPGAANASQALREHAEAVRTAGGSAHLLSCTACDEEEERRFRVLFDRAEAYAQWHRDAAGLLARTSTLDESRARREELVLRRALDTIVKIDFFPGAALRSARAAMAQVEATLNVRFSPHEPSTRRGTVTKRDIGEYVNRIWATRERLWVDRAASAWLIRRRIDRNARFLWLSAPEQCPVDAVGFDFDGAEFSHVGEKVTFEVLVEAFALDGDTALMRLGELIHYLDVGGAPVPEAPGVLALIGAARERCEDDAFLDAASALFDDLIAAFTDPAGDRA
jgi:hypothetical protein